MIAQVYVDLDVPHLDRVFDYDIPETLAGSVAPGVRVKVRFAGRLLSGYVVGLSETSTVEQRQPLAKVVSPEVVMPPPTVRLIRAVADHCAGLFMDVARLAIPPRSAAVEQVKTEPTAIDPVPAPPQPGPIDLYPTGDQLRQALRVGRSPRAAWLVAPVQGEAGDWAVGLASLAADTVASGRSALLLVPDAKDCARLEKAVKQRVATPIARLAAGQGPASRYRNYLSALRGTARVLIGTRSAAYTPLPNLGLIGVWDEADGSLAEPRCPYPQLRDIVAIRAAQEGIGLVFAARAWSAEIQSWVDKGWLTALRLPSTSVRFLAPAMRVASSGEQALDRDAYALSARLPHDVFDLIRATTDTGPVLVWVPWAGTRRNLTCSRCGTGLRCACGGAYAEVSTGRVTCRWCGRPVSDWQCDCGSTTWRASTVGSATTADELAQAFPRRQVIRVDAAQPATGVVRDNTVVVATPGSEPPAENGYAAAVILDAVGYVARPDLRAGEQAVRRWLDVTSLVRPGQAGGTVLLVGPSTDRAIQAVIRLDPVGFSARELADRQAALLPPAVRLALFSGEAAVVTPLTQELQQAGYETLGPTQETPEDDWRLVARAPADQGDNFAAWLQNWAKRRSAAGRPGKLSWRLDPVDLG